MRFSEDYSECAAYYIEHPPSISDVARNLTAVRGGAMVCDAGIDDCLLRDKLIRRNSKGWYSLTESGRTVLSVKGA